MGARRLHLLVRRQRPTDLSTCSRPILVNVVLDRDASGWAGYVRCRQHVARRTDCVDVVRSLTVLLQLRGPAALLAGALRRYQGQFTVGLLQATVREILRHDEALVAATLSTTLLADTTSRNWRSSVPADAKALRVAYVTAHHGWIR